MTRIGRTFVSLLVAGGLASPVVAQPARADDFSRATTLQGVLGPATDASASALFFGGSAGWSLTPRFGLEAAGEWFFYNGDHDAFAASFVLRTRLASLGRASLFTREGVGLYRASFPNGCAAAVSACDDGSISRFYRRRWATSGEGVNGRVFTDPSFIVGAGVDVPLSRRVAIRPAVDARIVVRDRDALVVTTFGLAAVVQFEHHPVTPLRRR